MPSFSPALMPLVSAVRSALRSSFLRYSPTPSVRSTLTLRSVIFIVRWLGGSSSVSSVRGLRGDRSSSVCLVRGLRGGRKGPFALASSHWACPVWLVVRRRLVSAAAAATRARFSAFSDSSSARMARRAAGCGCGNAPSLCSAERAPRARTLSRRHWRFRVQRSPGLREQLHRRVRAERARAGPDALMEEPAQAHVHGTGSGQSRLLPLGACRRARRPDVDQRVASRGCDVFDEQASFCCREAEVEACGLQDN